MYNRLSWKSSIAYIVQCHVDITYQFQVDFNQFEHGDDTLIHWLEALTSWSCHHQMTRQAVGPAGGFNTQPRSNPVLLCCLYGFNVFFLNKVF